MKLEPIVRGGFTYKVVDKYFLYVDPRDGHQELLYQAHEYHYAWIVAIDDSEEGEVWRIPSGKRPGHPKESTEISQEEAVMILFEVAS